MIERSEEHTSELQSPYDLVCRLLLEKKKTAFVTPFPTRPRRCGFPPYPADLPTTFPSRSPPWRSLSPSCPRARSLTTALRPTPAGTADRVVAIRCTQARYAVMGDMPVRTKTAAVPATVEHGIVAGTDHVLNALARLAVYAQQIFFF